MPSSTNLHNTGKALEIRPDTAMLGKLLLAREMIDRFPRIPLGSFPTRLAKLPCLQNRSIWLKDDGHCSAVYAGNKVRKLEYLFPVARERGANRLVLFGDIESHTVAATAMHGRANGFEVDAVLYPHKGQTFSSQLDVMKEIGCCVRMCSSFMHAAIIARSLTCSKKSFYVPLGGSTPLSTLGYVAAALELLEQFISLKVPVPERVYVPFATGGTVAGLAIGFALAEAPIQVFAVRTVESVISNKFKLARLVAATLNLIGVTGYTAKACLKKYCYIEHNYLGRGYRDVTPESALATSEAQQYGLELDTAFSGKAFAAAINAIVTGTCASAVFWNTHSQSKEQAL